MLTPLAASLLLSLAVPPGPAALPSASDPAISSPAPALTDESTTTTDAQPNKGSAPKTNPDKKEESKQPDKKTEPAADPTTEDVIKDIEKQRGNVPPPTPSLQPPPAPATKPIAVHGPAGRLLREGTFLVDRRGRLVRSSTGDWLFSFDADAKGQADPTMIMIPCQSLESMEKLAERYGESLSFIVTGQVFVYHSKNHLLVSGPFSAVRAQADIKTTQ